MLGLIIFIGLLFISPLLAFVVLGLQIAWICRRELKKDHEEWERIQQQLKENSK